MDPILLKGMEQVRSFSDAQLKAVEAGALVDLQAAFEHLIYFITSTVRASQNQQNQKN